MPDDAHILYRDNIVIVSRWHYNHPHWIQNENWCLIMSISYIVRIQSSYYVITVTVEFPLKNGAENIYIHIKQRNCLKWLVQCQIRHYHWIHIEKWVLEVYRSLYNDWIKAAPKWVYIVLNLVCIQGYNGCHIMWSVVLVASSILPYDIFFLWYIYHPCNCSA